MKITVEKLYGLSEGLIELLDREVPTKVALAIQRNSNKVSDEIKASDEVRKKIVDKYIDKDNGDGTVDIKKDKIKDYQREINELMNQELEVKLHKIKANDLGARIKPRTLILLEPILEEGK